MTAMQLALVVSAIVLLAVVLVTIQVTRAREILRRILDERRDI